MSSAAATASSGASSSISSTTIDAQCDPRLTSTILPNRLFFTVCEISRRPQDTSSSHFFMVDDLFRYDGFFSDFGPFNINVAYKFSQLLREKLKQEETTGRRIYFYTWNRPQNRSNAAVLLGIYLIVYHNYTSGEAYEPLKLFEPFMPFRDASQSLCTFRLMPQHCFRAVSKALKLKFFNWETFNSAEYEHFETVENGDLNVIIPGKFIAFSGPHASNISPEGYPALTPTDYHPIFALFGVKTVIRLNKKCYDRKDFIDAGIAHHDLYFVDGTTPSNAILDKFLSICESAQGSIAVHCKAGLGRTGTTIGCYMMKHYHFSAAETIAWLRLCRPGCVIGPQQHYLKLQEPRMWKLGASLNGANTRSPGSSASSVASNDSSVYNSNLLHPAPLPSYASSQPNSPLGDDTFHSHPSYSASFETPPTMNQQRVTKRTNSTSSSSSSSTSASHPASSYPNTRSASNHGGRPVLGTLITRGRSKLAKGSASSALSIYTTAPVAAAAASSSSTINEHKDSSSLVAATTPQRTGSNGSISSLPRNNSGSDLHHLQAGPQLSKSQPIKSAVPTSTQRSLFDSKAWLQPTSPLSGGSTASNRSSSSGRRSPGALNVTKTPSAPLTHSHSPLFNQSSSAGSSNQFQASFTTLVSPPSVPSKSSPTGSKLRTSSRIDSALGFRQVKQRTKV